MEAIRRYPGGRRRRSDRPRPGRGRTRGGSGSTASAAWPRCSGTASDDRWRWGVPRNGYPAMSFQDPSHHAAGPGSRAGRTRALCRGNGGLSSGRSVVCPEGREVLPEQNRRPREPLIQSPRLRDESKPLCASIPHGYGRSSGLIAGHGEWYCHGRGGGDGSSRRTPRLIPAQGLRRRHRSGTALRSLPRPRRARAGRDRGRFHLRRAVPGRGPRPPARPCSRLRRHRHPPLGCRLPAHPSRRHRRRRDRRWGPTLGHRRGHPRRPRVCRPDRVVAPHRGNCHRRRPVPARER